MLLLHFGAATAYGAPASATVDLRQENGYGRIVLTFDKDTIAPEHRAQVVNGVFVVSFKTPVDVSVDAAAVQLAPYIAVARRDPDGSALRFALRRAMHTNVQTAGEFIFIDLLPDSWQGDPPGIPAEIIAMLARRAEEKLKAAQEAEARSRRDEDAPTLELRTGVTPTFTRLSFGWNVPFEAGFERSGNEVTVRFNQTSPVDLSSIRTNLPPLLTAIETVPDESGLHFALRVAPTARVRAFKEGKAYIVDLSGDMLKHDRVVLDEGTPTGAEQVSDSPPAAAPAPQVPAKPAEAAAPTTPDAPRADAPAASTPAPATAATPAPERPVAKVEPEEPAVAPAMPGIDSGLPVVASVARAGETIRLAFPFRQPVASAVFRRGDTLWLVFDSTTLIDLAAVRAALGDRLADIARDELPGGGQAIRIALRRPELTSVGLDGSAWIVSIGDLILQQRGETVAFGRAVRPDGTVFLEAAYPNGGTVHVVPDPLVGDTIEVATAFGPARSVLKPQSFVELATLPSAHGLAVTPLADDVVLAIEKNRATVSRKGGLTLSGDLKAPAAAPRATETKRPGFVDLGRFAAVPAADFYEAGKALEEMVANAEPRQRASRRVDLASLYLAHGLGSETVGILGMAAQEEPALRARADYRIMLAAGNTFAGRYEDAAAILREESLQDSPDAAIWRTVIAAHDADWNTAKQTTSMADAVVDAYPVPVQEAFRLAAAESAIERGETALAETLIDKLPESGRSETADGRRALLVGRIAAGAGKIEVANALYRQAEAKGDAATVSEATYRAVELTYGAGLVGRPEAIQALFSLTSGWRGDRTELIALKMLSKLLVADGRYRDAFQTMRSAMIADPGSAVTSEIQLAMADAFGDLYLDGKADKLAPVEALSLYYDYRDLTPIGRKGDEMVRKLAERLVAVDLLPQAAELLKYQVDNRLKGAARSQIAADLALVYLLDRKPNDAINVLRRTDQAELPALLSRQRRLVEARSLAEAGQPRQALELLATMAGDDVDRVRVETLWAAHEWPAVGAEIERMYGGRWSDSLPLSERERQDILRAAIAYTLGDDAFALDRLRTKYAAKMAESADAKAFDAVTRPIEAQGLEFRAVVQQIGAIDTMDAFLKDYRARYSGGAPASS